MFNQIKSIINNSIFNINYSTNKITINQINDYCLIKIFHYFDVQTLSRYKLVCKRWLVVINGIKFNKELIIRKIGCESVNNYWFYNYSSIDLNNTIICYKLDFLFKSSFLSTFNNLKYFKTNLPNQFDLRLLNKLTYLVHLEIDNIIRMDKDTLLYLPYLRILKCFIFSNYQLIINSNNLEILKCFKLASIEIVNAYKLIYLEVEHQNRIEDLSNLISLNCYKLNNIQSRLDNEILLRSPNSLQSLHFYYPVDMSIGRDVYDDLIKIYEYKNSLDIFNNLNIYFQGLKISNNTILQFEFDDLIETNRRYKNLEINLPWLNSIDYINLINKLSTIPSNIFEKLNCIQIVKLDASERRISIDQNEFFNFLKNCPSLSELNLIYPGFNSLFYQKLPTICYLIRIFKLIENKNIKINYEFILRFRALEYFSTTENINELELINKFINNLNFINEIVIKFKNELVKFKKITTLSYDIIYKQKICSIQKSNFKNDHILNLLKFIDKEK